MLPRTAEIVRVLRVRQHFFGRQSLHALSNIVSIERVSLIFENRNCKIINTFHLQLNQHLSSNDAFRLTYSRISNKLSNAHHLRCAYSSKKVVPLNTIFVTKIRLYKSCLDRGCCCYQCIQFVRQHWQ